MSLYSVDAAFNAVDNMSSVLQNITNSAAQMGADMFKSAQNAEEGLSLTTVATGALGLGIMGLASAAIIGENQVAELDSAMSSLQVRTGAGAEDMKVYNAETRKLFDSGLVSDWNEAAQAIGAASKLTAALPTEQAEKFAQDAVAAGNAWGQAPNQVIQAVQKFAAQFKELGEDPIKALGILEKVAQETNQPLSAIEQTVQRYGPKFSAAGLSAAGMGAMIVIGAELGAGPAGMGALAKAVDTFHNSIEHPSAGFVTAMDDLGLASVLKQAQQNKIPIETVLGDVGTALQQQAATPAQKAAEMSALFGKNISSVNVDQFATGLAHMGTTMDTFNGAAQTADTTTSIMEASWNTRWANIGNSIKDGLEKGFEWLDTLPATITTTLGNVETNINNAKDKIVGAVGTIGDYVTNAWDGAFGPTGTITTFVDNAVLGVETSINNAKDSVSQDIQNVITPVQTLWNSFFGANGGLVKAVHDAWDGVEKAVNGAVAGVKAVFTAIAKAAADALNPIIAAINSIIQGINSISGKLGGGQLPTIAPISIPGNATGGPLGQGWTMVGELGPELIYNSGAGSQVFTNQSSRSNIAGAGAKAGGGSPIAVTITGNNIYGAGGAEEFGRFVYRIIQDESKRRGVIN